MKTSKYFEPYHKDAKGRLKCTLSAKFAESNGVYMIRDKATKKPLYIGHSTSNLYLTIYRHFQSWKDSKQYRATFEKTGTEVRIITTTTTQAAKLERFLIRKFKPEFNLITHKKIFENDQPEDFKISEVKEYKPEEVFTEDWMNLKFDKPEKKTFKKK